MYKDNYRPQKKKSKKRLSSFSDKNERDHQFHFCRWEFGGLIFMASLSCLLAPFARASFLEYSLFPTAILSYFVKIVSQNSTFDCDAACLFPHFSILELRLLSCVQMVYHEVTELTNPCVNGPWCITARKDKLARSVKSYNWAATRQVAQKGTKHKMYLFSRTSLAIRKDRNTPEKTNKSISYLVEFAESLTKEPALQCFSGTYTRIWIIIAEAASH